MTLARTGYESQQTDEPVEVGREDNLFEPVPGDQGAHGRFDEQAKERSLHFAAVKNRGRLAAAGLGAGFLAWALGRGRRR
jgi:hypothetical protein